MKIIKGRRRLPFIISVGIRKIVPLFEKLFPNLIK